MIFVKFTITITNTITDDITINITITVTVTVTVTITIFYLKQFIYRSSSLSSSPAPLLYPNSPKKNMNIDIFFQHGF